MEDFSIWKAGELAIAAILGWGAFVLRGLEKRFDEQNAKIAAQDFTTKEIENKLFEMQTKFVTEDQLTSKLDPIHEDMREMKSDVKTLLSRVGRGN